MPQAKVIEVGKPILPCYSLKQPCSKPRDHLSDYGVGEGIIDLFFYTVVTEVIPGLE
jgi:hypothetical protein